MGLLTEYLIAKQTQNMKNKRDKKTNERIKKDQIIQNVFVCVFSFSVTMTPPT